MSNNCIIERFTLDRRVAIATLASLAAATLSSAPAAAQQQSCYSDSVVLQTTTWSRTVTFPKFDPALGDLQSISFTVASEVHGSAGAENTSPSLESKLVLLQFQNFITLKRPDNTILTTANPQATFEDMLETFDGVIDFAGTSGVNHPGIVAFDTETLTSPPPSSDLALFTGPSGDPGTITLPISAAGSAFATGSGNLVASFSSSAGATVTVCYNYVGNVPPEFTSPQCGATLMASVGVPFTVNVCASDVDPADVVTLAATTLPSGATANPVLPTSGNPACTTVTWTPLNNQTGSHTFAFVATDQHGRSTSCSFTVLVAECHLILGAGYGHAQQTIFGHQFDTQLRVIRASFPVTMARMPNIRLPPNHYIWAQVVMYNPQVFPSNPSQWSQVARVIMHGDGTLTTDWYGTFNGIHLDVTTIVDGYGLRRVRFPFTIEGM